MVAYLISVNIQSIPVGIPEEIGLVEIVMNSIWSAWCKRRNNNSRNSNNTFTYCRIKFDNWIHSSSLD
jgi:hypothetical protein